MSAKDSPHHHGRRADGSHEARQARESWEQQKLRELGLDDIDGDASMFCFHCRREMLERLARAQERGSVLFDMVRRHGLSPLPPQGAPLDAEGPVGRAPGLPLGRWPSAPRRRRAARLVLAAVAALVSGALVLWAALAHLSR
ncbi:hypothetical protein WMF37_31640 [Sorangium sp. So ce291]|uniref:hypothetical protein n=1 Tax=Sorangium sp. So ce291 TaxID=3133294 RepID=UPI003F634713